MEAVGAQSSTRTKPFRECYRRWIADGRDLDPRTQHPFLQGGATGGLDMNIVVVEAAMWLD